MKIRVGCDLVQVSRFKNMNINTLNKLFHPREWKNKKPESLAGIFAVKESCKKVFQNLKWHDIEVRKKRNGKPHVVVNATAIKTTPEIIDADVSISHDGDYALAVAVFLLKEGNLLKGGK